jgi:DNA-binding XRE family transcriptional regulator
MLCFIGETELAFVLGMEYCFICETSGKRFLNQKETKMVNESRDPRIDVQALGEAIKRRRSELGISLRDLADKTGVSASTLSRIENGTGKPDAATIATLSDWLAIPVQRIIRSGDVPDGTVIYSMTEPLPDIIEAHLRADKNMTSEMAAALSQMFRVAYNQFGGTATPASQSSDEPSEGTGDES